MTQLFFREPSAKAPILSVKFVEALFQSNERTKCFPRNFQRIALLDRGDCLQFASCKSAERAVFSKRRTNSREREKEREREEPRIIKI